MLDLESEREVVKPLGASGLQGDVLQNQQTEPRSSV